MTVYLDTSFLIAALVPEARSEEALGWLDRQQAGRLHVSDWVLTEMASALSLKVRMRDLAEGDRTIVEESWKQLLDDSLIIESVTAPDFAMAARFCATPALGLRAPDALHLAVAAAGHHRLMTFDRRMADAASALGIVVATP